MCKRPRLALAALSLFLCLQLWGTPSEAVPAGELTAISEASGDAPVSFDLDESRKVLKSLRESVLAEPARKPLLSVPGERRDVAQSTSSQSSAAPSRRYPTKEEAMGMWKEGLKRKMGKLRKGSKIVGSGKDGKNRKKGKASKNKEGRKSREVLDFHTENQDSMSGLNDAQKKSANSLVSTSAMKKGNHHRKVRHSKKKGDGSSFRSKKPQQTTLTHSHETLAVENVSQPKSQESGDLRVTATDTAFLVAASSSRALVSESPTPEPTAANQEPAMERSVKPVATRTNEPAASGYTSGPISSKPATTQTSEPLALNSSQPAARNSTQTVTAQPGALAAAKPSETATARSGGLSEAPLNNTVDAGHSGKGRKIRSFSEYILVPAFE